MLVTIQLGRRIRIDIRTDQELPSRVSALEHEVTRLREDLRTLDSGMTSYALSEDLISQDLVEEYLIETEELRGRIANIDFFKADRNHSHKEETS